MAIDHLHLDLTPNFGPGHDVQVYENPKILAHAVAEYTLAGFKNNQAVLLIGSKSNLKMIRAFVDAGDNFSLAQEQGRLLALDVEETLEKFMKEDMPDASKFFRTVGSALDSLNPKPPNVRVWGEMVNILWHKKNIAGTVRLEELWDDLAQTRPFYLLCTYLMNFFEQAEQQGEKMAGLFTSHENFIPNYNYHQIANALSTALENTLGISQSQMIHSLAKNSALKGFGPQDVIFWLQKHMPANAIKILQMAKFIYARSREGFLARQPAMQVIT